MDVFKRQLSLPVHVEAKLGDSCGLLLAADWFYEGFHEF